MSWGVTVDNSMCYTNICVLLLFIPWHLLVVSGVPSEAPMVHELLELCMAMGRHSPCTNWFWIMHFLGAIFLMVTSKLFRSFRACCALVIPTCGSDLGTRDLVKVGDNEPLRVGRWESAFVFIHTQKAISLTWNLNYDIKLLNSDLLSNCHSK